MKFKFIRLATLVIFVMSVVYMGPVQNVFGHSPSEHAPQFHVDCTYGEPLTNDDAGDDPWAVDPRDYRDYINSGGNGTGFAYSWDLRYYASPMISGGHDSDDEINFVFGAQVDFYASAGNSSCSGSATPIVTMDMGLTPDYAWAGNAHILLSISDTVAHVPQSRYGYSWCTLVDCPGGKVDEQREIEIKVSDTEITDKQSGTIEVSLTSGAGSVKASYTEGTDVQRTEVHAYSYGFSCTLSPTFWTRVRGLSDQMDKSAQTSGFLTKYVIDPADIYAVFDGKHIGNRFKGEILPGAMPWARRYIGNPILSGMLRILFGTYISDSHCGMRSFTAEAYKRMDLKTTGMEFASEMVIKAVQSKLKIFEIPITYHPRGGESKLNAIRDAGRHIRFMLKHKFSKQNGR